MQVGPTRKIYKTVADIISSPICNIFNQIVLSGIYPSLLKEACVTPIFKSGDNFKINNYRPISGLKILNIIFEKLTYNRFIPFGFNNILVLNQYGFRSGHHSCSQLFFTYLSKF